LSHRRKAIFRQKKKGEKKRGSADLPSCFYVWADRSYIAAGLNHIIGYTDKYNKTFYVWSNRRSLSTAAASFDK
jgi:hypothetical protein